MNKTEKLAYTWLTKTLGKTDIKYQHRDSPDFICTSDKHGYEVKRLYGHSIWMHESQFNKLKARGNCDLAIFEETIEPVAVIPIAEVKGRSIIDNILIRIVPDLVTLNVSPDAKDAFRIFKLRLKIDLHKDLNDDEVVMFVFSNFTCHKYEDGSVIWHLPAILKEPDKQISPKEKEELEEVLKELEKHEEEPEEEKSVEPQEEEEPVDKATQIARLKEKAAKIASGEIDVELTAEDYKKYGLKPREK